MKQSNIRSGTITAIEDQIRHPERVSVFLDGVFAFGLSRLVSAEFGLHRGQHLDEALITQIDSAEESRRAIEAAVQLLAHRPRSSHEIETRLARRGFATDAIEAALTRLGELGYVDDADFARFWVENRRDHQPRGRRLLRQELRQKGIEQEIVDNAVDDAEIDEYSAALDLARRRVGRLHDLEPQVQRRRLAGFLQRRGYSWDVVRPVLDTVMGELDEAESGESEL